MRKTRRSCWESFNIDDGIQLAARDKSLRDHRRRLQRIRPSVDMNTPRNFPKAQGNGVGTFSHEECLEIASNNKRLLRRLTNISNNKSKFAKMKKPKKARSSLNKTRQKQEAARIERENKFLVQRIMNCRPSINHKQIDSDWNRHRNIIHNRTVSKRKRKSFGRNRLSPISNTSSTSSTPMMSSRNESPYRNMNGNRNGDHLSSQLSHLRDVDIRDLQNMSPLSLQRFLASQSPLTTITERSMATTNSINGHGHYGNESIQQSPSMYSGKSLRSAKSTKSKTGKNVIFSPHIKVQSMMRDALDMGDDKEEEDDVIEEILSEWEHDEEWMQKERKSLKNRKKKKVRKNINLGLPMI